MARYPGRGHHATRERTRTEYQRLLTTFALCYFPASLRLGDIARPMLQGFITWLIDRPGRHGRRLADRSVTNALSPVRMCLRTAADEGALDRDVARSLVLPTRRGGLRWHASEARYMTRDQLAAVLAEMPAEYETLFVPLALTGLRISEAIALRWSDLVLDDGRPRLRVRRALVRRVLAAPKSRHGVRTIPLAEDLATRLRAARPRHPQPGDLVFPNHHGGPLCPR